jgi:hypothetical protein
MRPSKSTTEWAEVQFTMAAIFEAYSGEKNKEEKGVRVDKAIETNATIPRIATTTNNNQPWQRTCATANAVLVQNYYRT